MKTKDILTVLEKEHLKDKQGVLKALPIDLSVFEDKIIPGREKQRLLSRVVQNISNQPAQKKFVSDDPYDSCGDGIWEYFTSSGKVFVTENTYKMLGFTASKEKQGFDFFISRLHPEDIAKVESISMQLKNKLANRFDEELRFRAKDESWKTILCRGRCCQRSPEGNPIHIIGVNTDMTHLVQKRGADNKYQVFFEESKDVMFFSSPDGHMIDINPAGIELFGYGSREEIFRCDIGRDLYYNIRDRIRLQQQLAQDGSVRDFEVTLKRKNGRIVNALISASQILDSEGKISCYRGIIIDITEQKKLQQQLLQSQKMEAIGTLAGGIAHDFNNILGAILGYSELLRMRLKEGSHARANLEEIYKAGLRAADLVKQILTFSHHGEQKYSQLQLSQVAHEALKLIRASLAANIDIQTDFVDDEQYVLVDPSQIHQVIMNLCMNAAHALQPDGGSITISTKNVTVHALKIEEGFQLVPGKYVRLRIHDTGHGMSPEIFEQIFNPLFTTKPAGQGSGMGLPMALAIIKRHGGDIIASSTEGCGSVFDFYLPRIEKAHEEYKMDIEQIMPGDEHILFIDDEKAIVDVNEQLLNYLGYQTTVLTSPERALTEFKKNPQSFDLVITDLSMPKISGDKLLLKLKQINPQIPVIISTGYKDAFSDEDATRIGAEAIIKKPIIISEFSILIRKVLDAKYQQSE